MPLPQRGAERIEQEVAVGQRHEQQDRIATVATLLDLGRMRIDLESLAP